MSVKPHVVFYTNSGCEWLYTYEEVDILSDAELTGRYGWDIPVVLIDGTHAFKHRLTAAEFRRAIEQAASQYHPR